MIMCTSFRGGMVICHSCSFKLLIRQTDIVFCNHRLPSLRTGEVVEFGNLQTSGHGILVEFMQQRRIPPGKTDRFPNAAQGGLGVAVEKISSFFLVIAEESAGEIVD